MSQTTITVDQAVDMLFDSYPIEDILGALAERCLDESAILRGEGRPRTAREFQRVGEAIIDAGVVEVRD